MDAQEGRAARIFYASRRLAIEIQSDRACADRRPRRSTPRVRPAV